MLIALLAAIGVFALFFVLLSVRIIFLKDGEFKGTCSTQSPFLRNQLGECSVCGGDPNKCETQSNAVKS